MKHCLAFLFFLVGYFLMDAQQTDSFFLKADAFFKEHVKNGKVAYSDIKSDRVKLDAVLKMTEEIEINEADANVYTAFHINTYNLLVIRSVVENYPLASPLDVPGFFDQKKHKVAGQYITLNELENKYLRAKFPEEPRFHFVLVCAGLGCPPIINEAYMPQTIHRQMEHQTRKALNDPGFIQVNESEVKISQIFEWYRQDFEKVGGILHFINAYREEKLLWNAQLDFYPYDWSLNAMD